MKGVGVYVQNDTSQRPFGRLGRKHTAHHAALTRRADYELKDWLQPSLLGAVARHQASCRVCCPIGHVQAHLGLPEWAIGLGL